MAGLILRLLVLVVLVWLAIYFFRRVLADRRRKADPDTGHGTPAAMVACARCGLHVPATEAVYRDERPYCCPAHAEADD